MIDGDYYEYNDDYCFQKNTRLAYKTLDPYVETVYLENEIMQLKVKPNYKDFDKICFYK